MVLKPGVKIPTSSSLKLMQANSPTNSTTLSTTVSKTPTTPTPAVNAKPIQDVESPKDNNDMEEEEDETLIKFKTKSAVEPDISDNTSQSSEDLEALEEKE